MNPLESRIFSLLTGPVVARIRFSFPISSGHITITQQTFHRVAEAIRLGSVKAKRAKDLGARVGAQYRSVANTLEVQKMSGRLDEAMVVHEALHAAYDLMHTSLDANSEEASGYVCATLYCRMTNLPRPRWASVGTWNNGGAVADTLLRQYQQGVSGIPTVGTAEWQALRMSVAIDPVHIEKGGLTGLFLGQQFLHDG